MNENTTETTQTPEQTAPQSTSVEPETEMPVAERAKQASRRRAVEQRAKELQEQARQEQLEQQVLDHPLVKEAVHLLKQTRFEQDLAKVREAYPGLAAQSPVEVGEIYCRLMASGQIDPVVAYEAQMAADRRQNPVPDDMVSAHSAGGTSLYYSSRELDRLTKQDLKDPDVFRKAMQSLSKLRS